MKVPRLKQISGGSCPVSGGNAARFRLNEAIEELPDQETITIGVSAP